MNGEEQKEARGNEINHKFRQKHKKNRKVRDKKLVAKRSRMYEKFGVVRVRNMLV